VPIATTHDKVLQGAKTK